MKYSEMSQRQRRHLVDRLSLEQGGQCFLCGKRAKLVLDHNHDTDDTRRALCTACNTRLGMVEALGWSDWLVKALKYVGEGNYA